MSKIKCFFLLQHAYVLCKSNALNCLFFNKEADLGNNIIDSVGFYWLVE